MQINQIHPGTAFHRSPQAMPQRRAQPGSTEAADIYTGRHAITDLELRYQASKGAQIGLGVSNVFDVYPDATPATPLQNSTGVIGFPYYSPFGFNGRYLYVRAGLNW